MKIKGYTLLELMVAMFIVSILASSVYVYFQSDILQARRHDAKVALFDLSAHMEAYYAKHHTYVGATPPGLGVSTMTANHTYELVIKKAGVDDYEVVAIPSFKDTKCGSFIFNELGEMQVTGSVKASDCWG